MNEVALRANDVMLRINGVGLRPMMLRFAQTESCVRFPSWRNTPLCARRLSRGVAYRCLYLLSSCSAPALVAGALFWLPPLLLRL